MGLRCFSCVAVFHGTAVVLSAYHLVVCDLGGSCVYRLSRFLYGCLSEKGPIFNVRSSQHIKCKSTPWNGVAICEDTVLCSRMSDNRPRPTNVRGGNN